ncbi:MAG: CoA protein activase [Dehalococcoidales bacterium]|nr:CoA protein activase [Dehalococcoidales bacterium]
MRIGIPHLGNLYIPLKTLFRRLDVDYVPPPNNTRRTLSLGVKYAPEGLCMPFKMTLGNLIEIAELGADTLVMPGSYGTCRLGYYARTQEKIIRELGYDIEMVQLGVSERKFFGLMEIFKRLSNNAPWPRILSAYLFCQKKINAMDRIEKKVQKVRAIEIQKGTANLIYREAMKAIDRADDARTLRDAEGDYLAQIDRVDKDEDAEPLVVGVTGEFFVVLEPFSNYDIENELGKLGAEVRRTTFISEWMKFSMFLNPLGINEKDRIHRAAYPYLKRDIGGDGWETIGEKVLHSREYDGIVHLAPFTCMPEIIAQNIMPATRETLPVLTILCDEQMTKTGVLTRLEAFVDLLKHKRRALKNQKRVVSV